MNRYSQHLVYSALAALAGLPMGCLLVGLGIVVYGAVFEFSRLGDIFPVFIFGMSVAMFAVVIGVLPVFLYGVPVYAWLSHRKWANALTALGMGLIPGLAILPFDANAAMFPLIFGAGVALCTHLLARRRLARLQAQDVQAAAMPISENSGV